MPGPKFSITLIRHGETEENVRAIIQGQKDTKLNATGILQAQTLAATFPIQDFGIIYSSDLSRAYDTCKALVLGSPQSQEKGFTEKLIRTDKRLRERCFGTLQGQTVDNLVALAKAHGTTTVEYTPEGGETPADVRARVIDFLENRLIAEVEHENVSASGRPLKVLLVSHGGVIREIISYFHSFGHHSFRNNDKVRFIPPNTAVNEFLVHYSPTSRPRIGTVEAIKVHDVSHLSEELRHKALNQKQVNNKTGPAI